MEVEPLEILPEDDDEKSSAAEPQSSRDRDRRRSRLNTRVAITVALLATFMGICKVKDDNIVQGMQQAQATALDEWSYYQARNIREEIATATLTLLNLEISRTPDRTQRAPIQEQANAYFDIAKKQVAEKETNKKNAQDARQTYDDLNYRDDQFDLSDALLAISISLLAMTSLTQKEWLYWVAMVPTAFGTLMGFAGILAWHIHPEWLTRLLS